MSFLQSRLDRRRLFLQLAVWYTEPKRKMAETHTKKIVIVGAGFAGLSAALELEKTLGRDPKIELIAADREAYHLFTPSIYEVATAEEEFTSVSQIKGSLAVPYARIFKNRKISFIQGELLGLDTKNHSLQIGSKKLAYDYLVLALGDRPDFSTVEGAARYAYALGSLPAALRLRNALEFAVQSRSRELSKPVLNFVIAGGGYVAAKLAGEMKSFLDILAWKYGYPRERMEIVVTEGSGRMFTGVDAGWAQVAESRLRLLGVRLEFHHRVVSVNQQFLEFLNGERMSYEVLVWALSGRPAGVPGFEFLARTGDNRIVTDPFLRAKGFDDIFIAGNLGRYSGQGCGDLPKNTAMAYQEGRYVGQVLPALLRNRKPEPFKPHPARLTIRIGGRWAIYQSGKLVFSGFFAYLADVVLHFFHYRRLLGFWPALRYVCRAEELFSRND